MADDIIGLAAVLDVGDFNAGYEILSGALRSVGEMAVDGFLAAGQAVGQFVTKSFDNALEAEQTLTRLGQVIETTGGAAGLTVDQAQALGNQFADLAGGTDDTVLAIEEMALRMGNISGDEMPDFIQTTLDLAAATGVDAVAAARQLAQTYEDPISTLGKFQKQGILFTEAQQEQIKTLQKSGDTAGAFALVMDRVGEATGGAALANSQTLSGQMEIFENTISEAGESVLTAFLPVLHELFDQVIAPAIPIITDMANLISGALSDSFEKFPNDIIGATADLIYKLAYETGIPGLSDLGDAVVTFSDYWTDTLQPAIEDVWNWMQMDLFPLLSDLWDELSVAGTEALGDLADFWSETLLPAMTDVWNWLNTELFPLLATLWNILSVTGKESIEKLQKMWVEELLPDLQEVWKWVQENLFPLLNDLWIWLKDTLPPFIQALATLWTETLLPAMIKFSDWYRDTLGPILAALFEWLSKTLPPVINALATLWTETLLPAIQDVWNWINDTAFPIAQDLLTWLETTLTGALSTLAGYWTDTLQPALEGVWSWMNTTLFPFLSSVENLLSAVLGKAVSDLAGLWKDTLLPAITSVYNYFDDYIGPILGTIAGKLTGEGGLLSKLQSFGNWITGTLLPFVLKPLQTAFSALQTTLETLTRLFNGLSDDLDGGDDGMKFSTGLNDMAEAAAEAASELENLLDLGRGFSGTGGTFASLFKKQTLDPLQSTIDAWKGTAESIEKDKTVQDQIERIQKSLKQQFTDTFGKQHADFLLESLLALPKSELEQRLQMFNILPGYNPGNTREQLQSALEILNIQERQALALANARQKQAEATAKLAEEEKHLLDFQKQQQDLSFLQAQIKLLDLISEHSLNQQEILGGLQLGLGASVPGLLDAMTRALQGVVSQTQATAFARTQQSTPANFPTTGANSTTITTNQPHFQLNVTSTQTSQGIILDFALLQALSG